MPDDVNQIEQFWSNRLVALQTRSQTLRSADLPQAATGLRAASAAQASALLAAKQATDTARKARAALAAIPMPADAATLQAQWETARIALAQARADSATSARHLAEAQAALAALTTEQSHIEAELAVARPALAAAKAQAEALAKLKTALQTPEFAEARTAAPALLAAVGTARTALDALLPAGIAAVLAAQRNHDAAGLAALAAAGDPTLTPEKRRYLALTAMAGQARALIRDAAPLVAEAEPLLTAWAALAAGASGSPVSQDQFDLLDERATTHSAALAELATEAQAMAGVEVKELALALSALDWPPAGAQGYSAAGPDLAAREAEVATARTACDPQTAQTRPELWAARAALAQIPDDWVAVGERLEDLGRRLAALARPLGAADPAAAITALSAAAGQAATETGNAARVRDEAATRARILAQRRATAAMLRDFSLARTGMAPGAIIVLD